MSRPRHEELGRRERQIMEVVYASGRATAMEVRDGLSEPPSYSGASASAASPMS